MNIWDIDINMNPRATSVGYTMCVYINQCSDVNEM